MSVIRYKEFFKIDYEELNQVENDSEKVENLKENWQGIMNNFTLTSDKFNSFDNIPELLTSLGLYPSFTQANKRIKAGGVKINNEKVLKNKLSLDDYKLIGGSLWIIKYGKKDFASVIVN